VKFILYICEKCGKETAEKFGSGRFCSRACANSRERPEATRKKISISCSNTNKAKQVKQRNISIYNENPKYCLVCNTKIEYDRRFANTCTNRACQLQLISTQSKGNGGFRLNSHSYGKHGNYKGYRCDSTYELVYIIYNLDHDIYFERNTIGYPYEYNDVLHMYYPDFKLADGSFVEIKGQVTELAHLKLSAVNDTPIKMLTKADLKYAFDYVKQNYSYKNLEDLYE
jgi:hypothetical protein